MHGSAMRGLIPANDHGCEALEAPDDAGLCEEQEEPLVKAGEPPPAPSWTCSRSVGRKKYGNFFVLAVSFLFLDISEDAMGGSWGFCGISVSPLNAVFPSDIEELLDQASI